MSYLQPGDPAKRLRLFTLAIVIVAILFIGRLVQVQIIQAESINKQSLSSRSVTHTIPAIRGQILDSTGRVLARTVLKYDVNVAPVNVKPQSKKVNGVTVEIPVEQLVAQMAGILGLTPQEVSAKITGTGQYANVAKGVDANVYDQLKKLEIDWVYFDAVPSRTYPSGALAGSLIGFLSDGKPMGGIESLYDNCLAGVDGKETYEKGEDGIKIPDSVITTTKAVNGRDVHLTINADLQYFAQQVLTQKWASLKADWATAVVIEVKTGRILVAAEAPTMDPNDPGASSEASRHARVFESSFEPGSVIKTVTAATLVETGKANPETQVIAPYSWKLPGANGYRVTDSHTHGDDKLTLTGVLRD